MDASTNDEQSEYELIELDETRSDRHQVYVLLIHVIAAVIISVLSFSDGLQSWLVGTGLLTPILLGITGFIYGISTGINWYREEMIPYMCRTIMVQEFETDRFLKYKQKVRFIILIAGYLSIIITQFVWYHIATITIPLTEHVGQGTEIICMIFLIMILLYGVFLVFLFDVFDRILKSIFSDASQLIEFDKNWLEANKESNEKSKK